MAALKNKEDRKWYSREEDIEFLLDVIDGNTEWMAAPAGELETDIGSYIENRCENIRWESGLTDAELDKLVVELRQKRWD